MRAFTTLVAGTGRARNGGDGSEPFRYIHDFDGSRRGAIELPTSGLMSRLFGDNDHLVVTIDKADLAIGDFTKLRVQSATSDGLRR